MLTHTNPQLHTRYPVTLVMVASPVYWPNEDERQHAFKDLQAAFTALWRLDSSPEIPLQWHAVDSENAVEEILRSNRAPTLLAVVAMSGGIQPWLKRLESGFDHCAIIHAYLPGALDPSIQDQLLHRNAHPASTDFFAYLQLRGKDPFWINDMTQFPLLVQACQAVDRLKNVRLLKIGETEPWVINSTRSPDRFKKKWGTTIIPCEQKELYDEMESIPDKEVREVAQDWVKSALGMENINDQDVLKACKVTAAMKKLLARYQADGLSMACFSMIADVDTTSCLALSALNDSAQAIGACEGDLDAAVTLFLMKSLGADFVWIANPIIYPDNYIDLAHCTAPRCACGNNLNYRLLRHHESGRGVAPEVELPGNEQVTLVRIGDDLNALALHTGTTRQVPKMHTCHTQIRVHLPSTQKVIDSLLGTHLILSYGNWETALRFSAKLLELEVNPEFHRPPVAAQPFNQTQNSGFCPDC